MHKMRVFYSKKGKRSSKPAHFCESSLHQMNLVNEEKVLLHPHQSEQGQKRGGLELPIGVHNELEHQPAERIQQVHVASKKHQPDEQNQGEHE